MSGSSANLMSWAERARASSFRYQETTWLSADNPSPMVRAPPRLYMLVARNKTKIAPPRISASATYQKRDSSISYFPFFLSSGLSDFFEAATTIGVREISMSLAATVSCLAPPIFLPEKKAWIV